MTRRLANTTRLRPQGAEALFAMALTCAAACTSADAGSRADTVSPPPAAGASDTADAERLQTDEPLRKGMAKLRSLVHHHHSLVTHRRLPPDLAVRFAAQVRNETDAIVARSAVTAQSADVLTPILGKIVDGAEAIAGRKSDISQLDGIFLMDEALAAYGARFDDPSWKEIR